MSQKAEAVIAKLQAFFFKAMLAGYASDAKPRPVPGKPGYKMHDFREGNLYLIDEWGTTPDSDFSFGQTVIWLNDRIVWQMSYEGYYKKEAIPTLKTVLQDAYLANRFYGGRGVRYLSTLNGRMCYLNQDNGDFRIFSGLERIYIPGTPVKEMGRHQYCGRLMVDPETLG